MKSTAFILMMFSVLAISCTKHGSDHQKTQPAKIEKSDKGTPKIILTSDARKRLSIESKTFPKDTTGKRMIPVSALIYDTKGAAWIYVEAVPLEFHKELIQVLRTQGNQIQIKSEVDDSFPVVIHGAAELNGTESGVGK